MKRGVVIALVCAMLLLTSCGQQDNRQNTPQDDAARLQILKTGVQGVQTRILPNYLPPIIYDSNPITMAVEVYNKGNYPLQPQDCYVKVMGFDPNIIRGSFNRIAPCSEGQGTLDGRELYNVEGTFNHIEFDSTDITLPQGLREHSPTLNILTCYNYETVAQNDVCLDPLFYDITPEQKACIPQDIGMAGGEGGPVGVDFIGVDMIGGKAIFEINVRNYGSGRVLSPNTDIRTCGTGGLTVQDFNRVQYSVSLPGGNVPDCKPRDGFVRMNNGLGKILCTAQIPSGSAYKTPITIDLDYGYIESLQQPIRIVQTPR